MDDGQKEWLAEHLGHEFNIHKNNYVLQEPIIELAKISRLLIAVENGDAAMFVGKKLQDISTEGLLLDTGILVMWNSGVKISRLLSILRRVSDGLDLASLGLHFVSKLLGLSLNTLVFPERELVSWPMVVGVWPNQG